MMDDDTVKESRYEATKSPNGLFNFSKQTVRVTDADEEIMELYMNLASTSTTHADHPQANTGGLGFLDPKKQVLDIEIILRPPNYDGTGSVRKKRGEKGKGKEKEIVRRVTVVQDLESLKGRKGDTGSVLWRSSLYLAQNILQAWHFPPIDAPLLLDPQILSQARILELGAGTGLLPTLLSPLVRTYTASDLLENLKLVKKNLDANKIRYSGGGMSERSKSKARDGRDGGNEPNVYIEEIDWVDVSARRSKGLPAPCSIDEVNGEEEGYDLILAVDCIYNEYLIKPLIDTFERYCPKGGKGVVWVVCELRSSDVMTTFLETWLAEECWVIVRLDEASMGGWEGRKARWVGWVGWRS